MSTAVLPHNARLMRRMWLDAVATRYHGRGSHLRYYAEFPILLPSEEGYRLAPRIRSNLS